VKKRGHFRSHRIDFPYGPFVFMKGDDWPGAKGRDVRLFIPEKKRGGIKNA